MVNLLSTVHVLMYHVSVMMPWDCFGNGAVRTDVLRRPFRECQTTHFQTEFVVPHLAFTAKINIKILLL